MAYRPGGVTALAVIFIIIAALGVIGAIAIEAIIVVAYQSVITSNLTSAFSIIFLISYFPYPLPPDELQFLILSILLSTLNSISSSLSYIGYLHLATFIVLIVVIFYVIAAVGLLRMKSWGRYLALIIGIFDIIVGTILSIAIVGIIPLIFGIVIVWYLMGDVKYEFE